MIVWLENVFWLLAFCPTLSLTTSPDLYHERFLREMDTGQRCHYGYIALSQRVQEAALNCARIKSAASYLCYLICVFRGHGYIVPESEDKLDLGIGDLVTQESFDMTTKKGRDSYFAVAFQRYSCADFHIIEKSRQRIKFPYKFDNATACEPARPYFKCLWDSLTCGIYGVEERVDS